MKRREGGREGGREREREEEKREVGERDDIFLILYIYIYIILAGRWANVEELRDAAGRERRAGPAGLLAFLEEVALVAGEEDGQARKHKRDTRTRTLAQAHTRAHTTARAGAHT